MATVGVVLSGCGVFDGSEIHEAVLTLLALDRAGAKVVCMAPNMEQMHVVNHLTGQPVPGEKRNVLVESARIARGNIKDIAEVQAKDLDALIFPGGYGAAKNLCTFATQGADCQVNPQVARLAREVHQAGKPIGAICISPAMIAKIFQGQGPIEMTIGFDAQTAAQIEKLGHKNIGHCAGDFVVDNKHKIVTTPAYMEAKSISEAAEGIEKLVKAVLELVEKKQPTTVGMR